MNSIKLTAAAFTAIITLTIGATAEDAKLPPAATKTGVTYATDIKPIFDATCVKCHDSTKKPRGGVALDTLEGALKGGKDGKIIVVGNSAKSDIVLNVARVGDPDTFMPRGKGAKPLTPEQVGLIRAWIDQGAK